MLLHGFEGLLSPVSGLAGIQRNGWAAKQTRLEGQETQHATVAMRRNCTPQIRGKSQTLQVLQGALQQQEGSQSRWVLISGSDSIFSPW